MRIPSRSINASGKPLASRSDRPVAKSPPPKSKRRPTEDDDDYKNGDAADEDDENFDNKSRAKAGNRKTKARPAKMQSLEDNDGVNDVTPRKLKLLPIVNSRDVDQIKGLSGFGAKKARDLVDFLELMDNDAGSHIQTLEQLRGVPGMGGRMVDRAYEGLTGTA